MNGKNDKPDYICVGPHKTGTGWLYETLNRHRQVYPIDEKEIRYYTKLDFRHRYPYRLYLDRLKRPIMWLLYGRFQLFCKYPFIKRRHGNYHLWWECLKFEVHFLFWPTSLRWYESLFDGPKQLLQGDISPSYANMDEHSIRLVKKNSPQVKIIFFLREPVERIWSHVKMLLAMKRYEPTSKNIARLLSTHADSKAYQSYPYHSLQRWLDVFGSEQVFIGFYEELVSDPVLYYEKICRFLEIEDDIDQGVQLEIAPYRIGHLLRPPQIFESAQQVIQHRWKSSRIEMAIPMKLRETLIAKYKDQVLQLDQLLPNSYPAQWLDRYDEKAIGPSS